MCYKQYSHYDCIKTILCNDIAQSWKRQKCIFLFCISNQVLQACLYAESLDSHPFISCGKKERILRYWNSLYSEEIPDLLKEVAWMQQSGKTTWVTKIKELFDKAVVCLRLQHLHQRMWARNNRAGNDIWYRYKFIPFWENELHRQSSRRDEVGNKL